MRTRNRAPNPYPRYPKRSGLFLLIVVVATTTSALADRHSAEVAHRPDSPMDSPAGEYSAEWGPLTLWQAGGNSYAGAYSHNNGRVTGMLNGLTLTGIWTQTSSGERCSAPRQGSSYWGRYQFNFSQDFSSFSGPWGNCDGALSSSWAGTRIVEAPQLLALRFLRETSEGMEPVSELVYGQPFFVEAEFDAEPEDERRTVTLDWGAGATREVVVARTAEPTVYRSRPLQLARPGARGEQ